jgi:hypothetical protein
MQNIRTEYTGSARRIPVCIAGDAEHMRITLVTLDEGGDGKKEKIIFTGSEFLEEKIVQWKKAQEGKKK